MNVLRFSDLCAQGKAAGQRVFIRADLNVPQDDSGAITEDTRIRASVPCVQMALDAGAAVMVTSHLGRPKEGEFKPEDSLAPVARRLGELLGREVPLVSDWVDGVDVKPGQDPEAVGRRLDQIIEDFVRTGPTEDEVRRTVMRTLSGRIQGLEQVGGFGGKAVALAEGQVYAQDSDFYKKNLNAYAAVTPAQIKAAMQQWLSRPAFGVRLEPGDRPPIPAHPRRPGVRGVERKAVLPPSSRPRARVCVSPVVWTPRDPDATSPSRERIAR